MSDSDSDRSGGEDDHYSSEEEDVDIHHIVLMGTPKDVDWALSKDRTRLINLKQKDTLRFALHVAALAGRMDICTLLIKRGSLLDPKDAQACTPLMLAASKGFTDISRMLIECGASLKCKDNSCWTALHHAVTGGHEECSVMLIKRGVDISAEESKFGKTALHFCSELGLHLLADTLIIRGADMYASGDSIYSKTPLHLAAALGHKETVSILVRRGAELEAMSGFLDKTPLHLAAEKGNLEAVQVLVEAGADMGAFGYNVNGSTPLHLAAQFGHEEVVKYLVAKGSSLQTQGMFTVQGTAMHIAVQYGQIGVVHTLLELGADLEQRDGNGLTAMHTSCKHKQWDIAFMLIDKGASLMAEAHNGRYPLEFIPPLDSFMKEKLRLAGLAYDQEMERLAHLAAKRIKDEEEAARMRAAIAAEEARLEAIALVKKQKREALFCSLLLAAVNVSGELSALTDLSIEFSDLDINIVLDSTLGARAITRAAFNGFNVIVAALLKWDGVDINVQEKDGNTALHMAASRGKPQHKSIVEMLLLHNARIGIPNNAGKLAATVACTTYLAEIIRNPRLIQTRTQMEVLSMSPHMNNSRDSRAKTMGNAMATVTGGTANLLSLMSSTKIGEGMSATNASANALYSPAMTDPATLLLADAYGQNYSPVKPLMDTWKTGNEQVEFGASGFSGKGTGMGMGTGMHSNVQGQFGAISSNNIAASKLGHNEFLYSNPMAGPGNNGAIPRGVPEVNEYGNIYMPTKYTSVQEVNYQRELRGLSVSNGSLPGLAPSQTLSQSGAGSLSTSIMSAQFNPGNLSTTFLPVGFSDFPRKASTQYQLRDEDPGYVYSYSHFAETNKIPPLVDDKAGKRLPKVDMDTENFTRGKFGAVPSSFRGCLEDVFFAKYNAQEEVSDAAQTDQFSKDLLSAQLRKVLDAQGEDYDGYEIDALVSGDDMNIKDNSRIGRADHLKFELAKLRHQIRMKDIPAQAAHTPTAFDATDEWITVRDYMWLLGYPYKQADPSAEKRVLLRNIAMVMDEFQRIFTDPDSLAARWMDPLALEMNNRNNYSKSELGSVQKHNLVNLGDTRSRFIKSSSDQLMKEIGQEGMLHSNQSVVSATEKGKSEKIGAAENDSDSVSIPGTNMNNSNIEGGKAFGFVDSSPNGKTARASSRSPSPPKAASAKQLVFANQKSTAPASNLRGQHGPQTLAEAADWRITQLCLQFVTYAVEVFAPPTGWPDKASLNGKINSGISADISKSQSAVLTSRIAHVFSSKRMSDNLQQALLKLLEAASRAVANSQPGSSKSPKGGSADRSQLPPVDANHALVFPPRQRRVVIDSFFEVAEAFKERAEADFPVDSIRAHLWAHNGRKQYLRYVERQEADTDMTLWLRDLHLEGTIVAFKQLGFKEMSDFTDLSLEDVQEYFPFLKMGDAIRMSRNIKLFTPDLLAGYQRRVQSKDKSVGLPPIPNLAPPSLRKLQSNPAGKAGPTPSRKVKVAPEKKRPKSYKMPILNREPTREEYLAGFKLSDFYLQQLNKQVREQTDGVNLRLAGDLEHAQDIIRKKGLVKQVIARMEDGGIIVVRASNMTEAVEHLQAAITKATKGFQLRIKSNLTVANDMVREAGLMGSVICREDEAGDIQLMKVESTDHAIQVLQEQVTKATNGFLTSSASNLETANKTVREAGMYGIVIAREVGKSIILERLHREEDGPTWELFVNHITTVDTLDLGTKSDHQDPCVRVWLGEELVGKTERVKEGRSNARFPESFHMHMTERAYNSSSCSLVVELFNETLTGALSHVGKGTLDFRRAVPIENFNNYVDITVPLWYICPENEGPANAHKETITDVELESLQAAVKKETEGFNLRLKSNLTHAKSLLASKGVNHLAVAVEADDGTIRVQRVDRAIGSVNLKIMVQATVEHHEETPEPEA